MSNAIMAECRGLQMHPAAKSVLMALADRADDDGRSWPSIEKLVQDTCFRKTAVIESIQWLEASAVLQADRSNGRHTTYRLDPKSFEPSAARTRTRRAPVRHADTTGTPRAPDPSATRTQPVRGADTNHQEPSRTHLSNPPARVRATKGPLSADRFVEFWKAYPRKVGDKEGARRTWAKKKLDERADAIIEAVAKRANGDPKWADLQFVPYPATYLNQERWNDEWLVARSGKPSVADSFAGKAYIGTPENELPEFLRTNAA